MNDQKKIKIGLKVSKNSQEGPNIFLEKFRIRALKDKLAEFYPHYSWKNEVSIFASTAPFFTLSPFILRLDGIYYDLGRDKKYNDKYNKPILKSYKKASGFIFQSHFAKELVESYFGEKNIPTEVIFNGSRVTDESPEKLVEIRQSNKRKKIICSSNWRPNKRLDAIIKTVIKVRKEVDCELIIIGNINESIPDEEFIKPVGYINNKELDTLLKDGNAFIHLCLLDNCPNSVIEAITNKLPVITSNLGGTKELIKATSGGIVSECDQEINFRKYVDQQNPPSPDIGKLTEDLLTLFHNEERITKQIDTHPVDIKTTAKAYVDFAVKVARKDHRS
tara:strand:- start:1546 stop:2547 length:1002 start_codon:yes stop_codon:yes gene_type:complete